MTDALLAMDGGILLWIQDVIRQGILDPIVCFYTKLGDAGMMWIALTLLLLLFPRTRRAGLASAFALLCSLICTNLILKNLFTRPRPWLEVTGLTYLVTERDPNSFPSGHTSAAFAAASAWCAALPRRWMKVLGLAAAVLMALSRLYVGVHYPSDVLCGVLVGLFCGWLGVRLMKAVERRWGAKLRLE